MNFRSFRNLFAGCGLLTVVGLAGTAFAYDRHAQRDHGWTHDGFVAIRTTEGRFFQAHEDNGETHGSNDHRSTEETWVIVEVDRAQHKVALRNYSNGYYLSAQGECARANRPTDGPSEIWIMQNRGGRVAFRAIDGRYLRSNRHGDDHQPCGGEVWLGGLDGNAEWSIEKVGAPSGGKVDWGGVVTDIGDIAGLIVSLAG
jgi:hypothetical protein